jgi:transcriptional regulator with XRE-family HTH domain
LLPDQLGDRVVNQVTAVVIHRIQSVDRTIESLMGMIPHVDSSTLGERLFASLQEKGWSYKEFQQKVQRVAGGARGTSYGTVWSYVNGEVAEPRPRIVQAMAEVLGLSTEWLASGDGPRTEKEVARSALGVEAGDERTQQLGMLFRTMQTARSRLPSLEGELLERRDHVLENLVVDLLESGGRGLETFGEGEVTEAIVLVAWLLALPLRMIGPDPESGRPDRAEEYVLTMATALRLAMPKSPEGQPFGALSRLRRLRSALTSGGDAWASHGPADGIGGAAH